MVNSKLAARLPPRPGFNSLFTIHHSLFLGAPPANPPRHHSVPGRSERLYGRLREAGEYDPELRDLQNVQRLLLWGAQPRLPGLIAVNHGVMLSPPWTDSLQSG